MKDLIYYYYINESILTYHKHYHKIINRNSIVGNKPFKTFSSVVGISAFILICSQFLGNVPVIQLAKPNVESLDDNTKRFAWAIISFVATVGGNLTITGSAGIYSFI